MKRFGYIFCIMLLCVFISACSKKNVSSNAGSQKNTAEETSTQNSSGDANQQLSKILNNPTKDDWAPSDGIDMQMSLDIEPVLSSSPEEAVNNFVKNMQTDDWNQIMTSFAVRDMLDNFNPDTFKGYPQPTIMELVLEAQEEVIGFKYGLSAKTKEEHAEMHDKIQQGDKPDPDRLEGVSYEDMEVLSVNFPDDMGKTHSEIISEQQMRHEMFGADSWDYCSALISYDGVTYFTSFELFVYDGNYEIYQIGHGYDFISYWGLRSAPCTEEDYNNIVRGIYN